MESVRGLCCERTGSGTACLNKIQRIPRQKGTGGFAYEVFPDLDVAAFRLDTGPRHAVKLGYTPQKGTIGEGGQEMSTAVKELPACPVETTLTLISDKWKVLILRDLMPGTKRFGELKKSIGKVSQKVLTAQLREIEDSGLLTRTVYAEVPPRVEYSLTELGRSLKPVLDAMWNWGEAYKAKNEQ